ncbi:hypothetical protein [Streptomyces spectabilis]|uniref:DUF3592 domain-containing protein n=1 Tax=Streptomyces spectabilis TaxID=68270 RepID=A0A516R817_STRST|nr:hypothetical protein [Streptomyces spectabilis]QDQ11791.1 hypothetical protein FH965_15440 [Streptomyces spectabilis]
MAGRTGAGPGRWRSVLAVCFGLVLLLVPAGFLAAVPDALARGDAYAAAPACTAGARPDSCTTTVAATVAGTEEKARGRKVDHWLRVTERGDDRARRVHMSGSRLYDVVRAGDRVSLTYWRGEIRTVRFGSATEETDASPADDWRLPLGIGLLVLPIGLGFLGTLWWWRRSYAAAAHAGPWQLGVGFVAGALLGCTGFVAAQVCPSVPGALLVTAFGVPPVAALTGLVAWLTRRRERRAVDTSDIVAVPPAGRQCVRAAVLGDVPYRVDGFDHLVVGDGPPAVTPDPDGRVARRPLPPSLTVRGVRAPRPDDPGHWAGGGTYDTVVIECRHGEATVLLALAREDAPVVLGALRESARAAG